MHLHIVVERNPILNFLVQHQIGAQRLVLRSDAGNPCAEYVANVEEFYLSIFCFQLLYFYRIIILF